MKKIVSFLVFSVLIIACGKDDDAAPGIKRIADDYSPNTIGSTWVYQDPFFTYTNTILDKSTTKNGKKYFAIEVKTNGYPPGIFYARKDGKSHIAYEPVDGIYDPDQEFVTLIEGEVGTTWQEVIYGGTENENTLELEIIETGGTYEVQGNTYSDVIVVKTNNLNIENPEEGYTLSYYAKGVGNIMSKSYDGEVLRELISYSIAD